MTGKLYVEPSEPVTVTWVAFATVTVKVDDAPAAIEVGLAVIAISGTGFGRLSDPNKPQPLRRTKRKQQNVEIKTGELISHARLLQGVLLRVAEATHSFTKFHEKMDTVAQPHLGELGRQH